MNNDDQYGEGQELTNFGRSNSRLSDPTSLHWQFLSNSSLSSSLLEGLIPKYKKENKPELVQELEVLTDPQVKVTYSTVFVIPTLTIAIFSALIFYLTAQEAGRRDAGSDPSLAALIILVQIAPVATAITNVLFNGEAFFDIFGNFPVTVWEAMQSIQNYHAKSFSEWCSIIISKCLALASSICTVIPYWYEGLGSSTLVNFLSSVSAILCIPVYYEGAKVCYEVAAYTSMQRAWLNVKLARIYLTAACYSAEQLKENIDIIENRLLLCKLKAALDEQIEKYAYTFYYASEKSTREALNALLIDETAARLNIFLNDNPQGFTLLDDPVRNDFYFYYIVKVFIVGIILGMPQNFGSSVVSYEAGANIHWSLGVLLVCCELMPGVGYTIKGMLGYGLMEALIEISGYRRPYMQQLSPAIYRWRWILFVVCWLSGFSNQLLNEEGVLYVGASPLTAKIIGYEANVATALIFSFPQCVLLINKLIEWWLSRTCPDEAAGINLQAKLNEFAHKTHSASLQDIQILINGMYKSGSEEEQKSSLPESAASFFKARGFKQDEINKIPTMRI